MSLRLALASILASILAAFASAPALAADQLVYAAPAGWVDVAQVPPPAAAEGATAVQVLLDDHQTRFDPAGDAFYTGARSRSSSLRASGVVGSVIWSPRPRS